MSTQATAAGAVQNRTSAAVRLSSLALALLSAIGLLAALALRLILLNAFPLREDEALYSAWALAARFDPLFLSTFPDKPPVFLWLQAVALTVFGPTAAGARLVSIGASVATVALMVPAARLLWPQAKMRASAGVVALWLLALNPFAISFAPTAYTDSLLTFFFLLALVSGMRGRWLIAGAALGAAIMTKQQGLLFAPLLFLLPFAARTTQRSRSLLRLAAGLLLVAAPVMIWDASRWAVAPSPWDLGARNYSAITLAPLAAWADRAGEWLVSLWYVAPSAWGWLLLGGCITAGLLATALRTELRAGRALFLVAGWAVGFALFHLVTTIRPWDRYLLPLVPVLLLVAAGPLAYGLQWLMARGAIWGATGMLACLLILAPSALSAAQGGFPVGADHGDLAGLDRVVALVRQEAEVAEEDGRLSPVLYERGLGWQLRFYLADLLAEGRSDLRWFASPVALADNAAKSPHRPLLLAEAAWAPAGAVAVMLATRGMALEEVGGGGKVRLYRIVATNDATAACDWCLSRMPRLPAGWAQIGQAALARANATDKEPTRLRG